MIFILFYVDNNFYSAIMSITLKEFGHFMIDFVNKNFVPLLKTGSQQHEKCLEHWKQVAEMISEIQKMTYWNFQSQLRGFNQQNGGSDGKQQKESKKTENNRATSVHFKTYDGFFDKKDQSIPSYSIEDPHKVNTSLTKEHSDSRNKSFKYSTSLEQYESKKPSQIINPKSEIVNDPEGFQKLIQSFRKLCTNFQSNHKKLMREDQNFKENLREEVTHF